MTTDRRHNPLLRWLHDIYLVWKREFWFSFHDEGVIIFFLVLCLVYPVLYALIYNTETAHDVTVVVVDDDRSADSRQFSRMLDATSEACVVQYVPTIADAQRCMHEKECYGIVHFDKGFGQRVHRGEQAHVTLYCDMGVMIRYKQLMMAMTAVQQTFNSQLLQQRLSVVPVSMNSGSISNEQVALGNTSMGLGSAVLPAIFILVLQQSMLLGICMLHGGSRERRLHNQGVDPLEIPAGVSASILGKSLCYWMIYIIPTIYTLVIAPKFFDFPQVGDLRGILVLVLPFLLASSFMGQALKIFANDRIGVHLVDFRVPVGHLLAALQHESVVAHRRQLRSIDMGGQRLCADAEQWSDTGATVHCLLDVVGADGGDVCFGLCYRTLYLP